MSHRKQTQCNAIEIIICNLHNAAILALLLLKYDSISNIVRIGQAVQNLMKGIR